MQWAHVRDFIEDLLHSVRLKWIRSMSHMTVITQAYPLKLPQKGILRQRIDHLKELSMDAGQQLFEKLWTLCGKSLALRFNYNSLERGNTFLNIGGTMPSENKIGFFKSFQKNDVDYPCPSQMIDQINQKQGFNRF